jgi:hypothetical protein
MKSPQAICLRTFFIFVYRCLINDNHNAMKKIGITLFACSILALSVSFAQEQKVPYLIRETARIKDAQLKTAIVGSYPRHTEEFNWDNAWVLYRTIETSYTSFGKPSAIEYTEGANKTRNLYEYDGQHNPTERINQAYLDGFWVNVERMTITYNNSGYETESRIDQWNGSAWVLYDGTQVDITMDGDKILVATTKIWNSENQLWQNESRETYTYNQTGNYPASVIMEEWENGWVFTIKVDYTWSGSEISQAIFYEYGDEVWTRTAKYIFEYPDALTSVMTMYTDDSGEWTEASRITTKTDSHGNTVLDEMEMYIGSWMMFMSNRYTLTYSGDNLTQRISETFSFGADWQNVLKEVFSNFASLGTGISDLPDTGITIFPNPAGKEAVVRITLAKAGTVTLSVFSISGQKVLEEIINSNGSDVNYQLNLSQVSPGSYILIARDKQGNEIGKTRLIKDKE